MSKLPSPQERPDLYDDFDGIERPAGYKTGVQVPERIQKLIAERQAKKKLEPDLRPSGPDSGASS